MKKTGILLTKAILVLLFTTFTACSDSGDDLPVIKTNTKTLEITTSAIGDQTQTAKQTGDFQKFSFKEGALEATSDAWDFAIRGRIFLVNGLSKYGGGEKIGLANEPTRTQNVAVCEGNDMFETRTSALGLPDHIYKQDALNMGYENYAAAISWLPRRGGADPRETWYFRSSQDRELLLLKPMVFVFKTHDGHFAKMAIKSIIRTNTDFDKKEDIDYVIQYYYNPEKGNPNLDEKIQ
ncbi:hypothetical protein [Tenacibaculum finnmarkense]|uniref:hypothetical protein n=1 Tax=Tenacibaculum finnmarkense TaxID=2781243 RepID=UPI000C6923D2|nr:hypothetical protein [Tenacibaculum finnmarkense]MCD8438798.1 hypothetical protein [Tenacibaculum finnmarkense genomovar ulcerans]MCG8720745.1 hypothetical protein [Tenacibaculum finnmarkense]SOS55983.1 conserved exported hypothetical protein [Tenacibaculum finnmarkense]